MRYILSSTYTKLAIAVALLVGVAGFATTLVGANHGDCSANSVIKCGVHDVNDLKQKIQSGDGTNSGTDIQNIFKAFEIDLDKLEEVTNGTVHKDGRVTVGGQTVATGVWSSGRQEITRNAQGSHRVNYDGGVVYMRPTLVSFRSNSLEAFVYAPGGNFQWAILKSCGNPVFPVAKPFGEIFKQVENVTQGTDSVPADTEEHALMVHPGDELVYNVSVTNAGNAAMTNTRFSDQLPVGVTLKADPARRNLTANLGTVPKNDFKFIRITVTVDKDVKPGTCITNIGKFVADDDQKGEDAAVVCVEKPVVEDDKFVKCVGLKANVVKGKKPLKVNFEAEFVAENLTVEGFTINFGDGNRERVSGLTTSHTYTQPGTFTARVTAVHTSEGTKQVREAKCAVKITVDKKVKVQEPEEPKPKPEEPKPRPEPKPEEPRLPDELPVTGPIEALGALAGSGGLGFALRGYARSRRDLLAELLKG